MTQAALLRLGVGLVLVGVASLIAFRYGDRIIRIAAALTAGCWLATTRVEMITGPDANVVLGGNMVAALGLLILVASHSNGWLWLMTAIEAVLFMAHAWFYGAADQPASALVVLNDALAKVNLVVLVIAAIRCRRRSVAPDRTEAPTD